MSPPAEPLEMDPAAEALFEEATGDLALGELEAAEAKYETCTRMDGEYFEAWHALGMARMKLGRYPEAIAAGLRSVELRPNDRLAWASLSLFYVRDGQIAQAEAAGAKARVLGWGEQLKTSSAGNPPVNG